MSDKHVYSFGDGKADGGAEMKNLLGGKGANLAEMTNLGIPVPPGFTITTDVCTYYYKHGNSHPEGLRAQVESALAAIEKTLGKTFGGGENPLLLSVRSGARTSMPGMMDTVLNLGLNATTVEAVIKRTNNERFAWDSYRRFVSMYGDVVMGLRPTSKLEEDPFEVLLDKKKKARGAKTDAELSAADLKELVGEFKAAIKAKLGKEFPEDPKEQLWGAIDAVFGSWNNDRAITYRRMYRIPDEWGTAVNVQAMVFGNTGDKSGTGVAFTRDPATGEKRFYGEFLINAQGEDVVAGVRTPQQIEEMKAVMPEPYEQLVSIYQKLEKHYRDMQDMEFTIEDGRLWMLQTRVGKRTGLAAIRIAVDMVGEGLISEEEAVMRADPEQVTQLLAPVFDRVAKQKALDGGRGLAKGLAAGPGAASGRVVFSAPDAVEWSKRGEKVILVRVETSPEDIKGMKAAEGILTAQGGMTSHAALVARQMGTVCVAGCTSLDIDYGKACFSVGGKTVKEGDYISIDGTSGWVIEGKIDTFPSEILQVLVAKSLDGKESATYQLYDKLMSWADHHRRLGVRTNADQPDQATEAIAFGAEGIGLCRTEHMFFGGDRINTVRQMILSDSEEGRRTALAKLEPMQREDFNGILRAMAGRPVTVRLLDPPLHEFLPHTKKDIDAVAKELGVSAEELGKRAEALRESNPMLGHRGCRLGITYPEVYEMQVRALMEAACDVKAGGVEVHPEIMIPLTNHKKELAILEPMARRIADGVIKARGIQVNYLVGTMIEFPRACLVADQLAEHAQFFSFGTNDLTQTTFGISRDDSNRFMPDYLSQGIYSVDPFVAIDQEGLGQLLQIAGVKGRTTRPDIKVGICGEHGGEPTSVGFCHGLGFDYVSCSPYRVPVARLAAAQAAIEEKRAQK
ncbi:MAG: pyruvate, phosphate dikinase [Myxococcales bacterium]|nr:pyruvate, phosphate dikinase [Myxococcales bacterium]